MGEKIEAGAVLTNDKVGFDAYSGQRPKVACDYQPPLGDGQGYRGLELLLLSLCVCSGTSVVALLRRMEKKIINFEIKGAGIRRDQHPTAFEEISLQFNLTSDNPEQADLEKALAMSEESICPVWHMLKSTPISVQSQILKP